MKIKSILEQTTLILFFFTFLFFKSQPPPSNTRFVNPTSTAGNFNNSFVKHLNSNKDQMFYSTVTSGSTEYLGTTLVVPMNESRMISRFDVTGLPLWTAQFYPASLDTDHISNDFACVDLSDNFYIVCNTRSTASTFKDAMGSTTSFSNPAAGLQKTIVKLDSNGNKIWAKSFSNIGSAYYAVSLTTDSAGDLFVVGENSGTGLSFDGVALSGTFIFKISGTTGNVLYSKVYPLLGSYVSKPVLDNSGNLYVFSEPLGDINTTNYTLDGITIPTNADHLDNLMLKFDATGTCVFGKNFYATSPAGSYYESWFSDVVFDGTDFIAIGDYSSSPSSGVNFLKLSGTTFPKHYAGTQYEGFLAKISTAGIVVWEKPLESFSSGQSVYTNINLDSNNDIYSYFKFKSELYYDGNTYPFDTVLGDKAVLKFDNNGTLKYLEKIDKDYLSGSLIDVFAIDKYNVLGTSKQANFLLYPITNTVVEKSYVATFGTLNGIYLRPINHYNDLSSVSIDNSSSTSNQFSFNLINNVNWSATSDQSWLTVSYLQLAGKNTLQTAAAGHGDSKITLTAETNNTGTGRTANVMLSGDGGVASKTIAVTQTGTLATGESKAFTTTIYPNPTSEFLNIETQQKISKIEIYDLSGKLLKSDIGNDKKIAVSTLSKGLYLIKIYTENGVVNSKFIKN